MKVKVKFETMEREIKRPFGLSHVSFFFSHHVTHFSKVQIPSPMAVGDGVKRALAS